MAANSLSWGVARMADFFVMMVVWLLVLFFVSAELYKRIGLLKAFSYSALISVAFCALCILIWFANERDGIAQVVGALIYVAVFGASLLGLGIAAWIVHRKKQSA